MRYEIHISDVRSFKSCRRKWNWSSPLRRNLESNVPYPPFFTGRAMHYALEMYYKEGASLLESLDAFVQNEVQEMEKQGKLWPQEKVNLDEQIELLAGMLDHYGVWVQKDKSRFCDENIRWKAFEQPFSVPLYNPYSGRKSTKVYLAGRFDGLVEYIPDGTFWIWENKTTRSIDELARSLDNDEQCGAYIYAAQETFKVPVTGVIYNIMRKKVPTRPHVLQNGTLSQNKSIDTTAEMYAQCVREQHSDMSLEWIYSFYGEILKELLDKGNKFFARIGVYRTPNEIDQLARDLWAVALEMTRESTPLYPTPSWLNCNFCHFKGPCLATNAGGDPEFLLSQEFRVREDAKSWRYSQDKEFNSG